MMLKVGLIHLTIMKKSGKRALPIRKNKKVIGLFKDELWGKIMEEFCALRAKTYPYLINGTAQKTIFPRSWNIIESSKKPRKYHLSINFLAEKKTVFRITEKFKTKTSQ